MLQCGLVGQGLTVLALALGLPWGVVGVAVSAAIFSLPIHGVTIWGATRDGPVSLAHFTNMLMPIFASVVLAASLVYAVSSEVHRLALHPVLALMIGLLTAYVGTGLALSVTSPGRRIIGNAWRAAQLIKEGKQAA
jgi:PST family polysaccharide transporter